MNAIVRGDTIVGNAGFKGAPNALGDVELGYTVLTEHRRHWTRGGRHEAAHRASPP